MEDFVKTDTAKTAYTTYHRMKLPKQLSKNGIRIHQIAEKKSPRESLRTLMFDLVPLPLCMFLIMLKVLLFLS